MSILRIRQAAAGRCQVDTVPPTETLTTDLPPEFGGLGRSVSSTDLLAAALGTCLFTSMERVCTHNHLQVHQLVLDVHKRLQTRPKRIQSIEVRIDYPNPVAASVLVKLKRAAETCPVKNSLHPDIGITLDWQIDTVPG